MQLIGSLFVLLSVVLGALASHTLESILEVSALRSFEVGVRYMLYHGLALLILSFLKYPNTTFQKSVFYLICIGTILFSGSIFILSFKNLLPFSISLIGPITPVGGTLLIIAWAVNIQALLRKKNSQTSN